MYVISISFTINQNPQIFDLIVKSKTVIITHNKLNHEVFFEDETQSQAWYNLVENQRVVAVTPQKQKSFWSKLFG